MNDALKHRMPSVYNALTSQCSTSGGALELVVGGHHVNAIHGLVIAIWQVTVVK